MFLAYMHIFQISKRHARHISSINKSLRRERSSTNQAKWHAKSTIRVFCVVVPLFVICWTMASWREICSVFRVCSVPATAVHVSRLLLKGHSMIDPIVYALHKKDILKELVKIITGWSKMRGINFMPRGRCSERSYTISFNRDQERKEENEGVYNRHFRTLP